MKNKELIKEAKQCKSQEELIELASKNKINLTKEDSYKIYFAINSNGELSDDELENTTGGNCAFGKEYNSGSTPKYDVNSH